MNQDIIDELETLIDWDYVESEGKDVIRYDYRGYSLWLYLENNSAEGDAPKSVINFLKENSIKVVKI